MYQFKRLMVALDFTEMDKTLIGYTAQLASAIKPEKIYFVNAQAHMDTSDDLYKDYPELKKPVDELLSDRLKNEVDKHFTNAEAFDISYQVLDGAPFEMLLEWTQIKKIDLLLVGRKRDLKGSGIIPQRLARKVMCSVLFVPENGVFSWKEILIPTDFSEHSKLAFDEALDVAKKVPGSTNITSIHTFQLPTGYYKTGKSEEEFIEIMNDHAIKKYNKFIEKLDVDGIELTPIFRYDADEDAALLINEAAQQGKANLIIIGARGRTAATAIFLGSVAEKLISVDSSIPLLVVKDKERTFNFLELLKKI